IDRQQEALIVRTQILTAKSQEDWERLVKLSEKKCERLNRGRAEGEFLLESVSVFQFRVRLLSIPVTVNTVFNPSLNKWIADDGRGNTYTVETRLNKQNEPRLYEIRESDTSGEPEYIACTVSQAVE